MLSFRYKLKRKFLKNFKLDQRKRITKKNYRALYLKIFFAKVRI